MRATHKKSKGNRQKRETVGIVEAARILGVHRSHLYRVLAGKRQGEILTARYRALRRKVASVGAKSLEKISSDTVSPSSNP
jgi:hypothetical protein